MSVKILIKRKFKKEALKDAADMLIKARTNAMGNTGYISTETLVSYEDPRSVLIISMWQSKEDWDRYRDSDKRKVHEDTYASIFEGPTEYQVYRMGM
jgi:heme-degrading monooxygenase HmoA